MDEMKRRGYNPDLVWYNRNWRGKTLGEQTDWCNYNECMRYWENALEGCMIYFEHNEAYLQECLNNLAGKGIIIDKEKL